MNKILTLIKRELFKPIINPKKRKNIFHQIYIGHG